MPESLRDAKVREFELLKQTEGMSVLEYDTKFNQLARYAPHMVVTDNMKAKRFANGLKEYLFRAVPLTRTSTYSDVLDMALRFEARAKERQVEREPRKKAKTEDKGLDRLKPLGQGQLLLLTLWAEARAIKLDQLLSQQVTLGGQELLTVRLVVIHIMGDVGDLVLVLDVASQVI